jgi:hypothetical protein
LMATAQESAASCINFPRLWFMTAHTLVMKGIELKVLPGALEHLGWGIGCE